MGTTGKWRMGPTGDGPRGKSSRHSLWPGTELGLLTLVLALGAHLRFKGLTLQSLWNDELSSALTSDPANSIHEVVARTLSDVHPPLYQVLLWLWYSLFGHTDGAGRAFSACVGIAGICSVYFLGKEMQDRETGILAALFTALNGFHIYYSQEVRSYALLFLLGTLSFLFFCKVLRDPEGTAWPLVAYILSTACLLYTHYFGLVLLAAQVVSVGFLMVGKRPERSSLVRRLGVAGATLLLLYAPMWGTLRRLRGVSEIWIPKPPYDFFHAYFAEYFHEPFVGLIFAVLILRVFFSRPEGERSVQARFILLSWVLLSLALPFLRSLENASILTPRNTIGTLPALLVLVALGLRSVHDRKLEVMLTLGICVMSWAQLFPESRYYEQETKQQWKQLAAFVRDQPETIYGRKWTPEYLRYYLRQAGSDREILGEGLLSRRFDAGPRAPFWIVDAHDPAPELLDADTLRRHGLVKIADAVWIGARASAYGAGWTTFAPEEISINPGHADAERTIHMPWAGSLETPVRLLGGGEHELWFLAKGTIGGGQFPSVNVLVLEGETRAELVRLAFPTTSESRLIRVRFSLPRPSGVAVRLEYPEDYFDPRSGEDRNLLVRDLSLR
jgi:hypothetical protein